MNCAVPAIRFPVVLFDFQEIEKKEHVNIAYVLLPTINVSLLHTEIKLTFATLAMQLKRRKRGEGN